jgi:hypothetical protein
MIKRCILHILEHGTVPAVALALAIAPTNSRSWQRRDLTEPPKRVTKILFSANWGRPRKIRELHHCQQGIPTL